MSLNTRLNNFLAEQQGTAGWIQKLENFIEGELQAERERVIKEIEGMQYNHEYCEQCHYHEALHDLLTALKESK
jgi:hypothetical protein